MMEMVKDGHINACLSRMLNILAYTISKSYFINFNIPFYNPSNIKHSFFFLQFHLNNIIYILPLSLSFLHFLLNS